MADMVVLDIVDDTNQFSSGEEFGGGTISTEVRSCEHTSGGRAASNQQQARRGGGGRLVHQDEQVEERDNDSFGTLSTKESSCPTFHRHPTLSLPISPIDKNRPEEASKEEDEHSNQLLQGGDDVVVQSMTQGELSAHTTFSLVEAMEKGDESYFTEGFVNVGELPCI
jgi:hypothetical protein